MRTSLTDLDSYLNNVMKSGYAPLVLEKAFAPNVNRNSDGTIDPPPLVVEGVTGALEPALPFTVSMQGINNKRLEFTLLINPANMNHNKTATVNPAYTRKGWVTQLWGPNQDLITSTGTTAAFMVSGTGLTSVDRRMSLGMHNFLALLYTYRNNGYQISDPSDINATMTRVVSLVHGVEISYDGQIFMGHFNNFTIDENAEKPFLFDYNFDFVVSSLSDNYNEVRGHFSRIGVPPSSYHPGGPKLLSQTKKRGTTLVRSTLIPRTQAIPFNPTTPDKNSSTPDVTYGGADLTNSPIHYEKGIPHLPVETEVALQKVLADIGVPGANISSTYRSPGRNASAIYGMFEFVSADPGNWSAKLSDMYKTVYLAGKSANKSQAQIQTEMTEYISSHPPGQDPPGSGWDHGTPLTATSSTLDISPASIPDNLKPAFEAKMNELVANGTIKFFDKPPKDSSYHLTAFNSTKVNQ